MGDSEIGRVITVESELNRESSVPSLESSHKADSSRVASHTTATRVESRVTSLQLSLALPLAYGFSHVY